MVKSLLKASGAGGAAGALLLLLLQASPALYAEERLAATAHLDAAPMGQAAAFDELRARLDSNDRALALDALRFALDELGDGSTLHWERPAHALSGVVRPISAYRDGAGRVCRRLNYRLSLGSFVREVAGTACREADGSWTLSG